MKKTIKQYMSELNIVQKSDRRSRTERDIENQYGKRIKYLWRDTDFFTLKEARNFFRELKKEEK
jgi:hypothetical protein